jgi:hypothetical protein
MSKLRTAVPIVLIAIGLFGVVAAIYADSSDWRAIWIGVASTGLSAGLVDGSAVLEARRREQVILRIAGQRVGRIHQRLLWIVQALFEVSMAEAAALPRLLRELDQGEINLTVTVPNLTPPRTKAAWVAQCVAEINAELEVALSLAAQTSEVERLERLDRTLRSGGFSVFLRVTARTSAVVQPASPIAAQAADVLAVVQEQFRYFSKQGGIGWRWGQLHSASRS